MAQANDWASGFMRGVELRPESWAEMIASEVHGGSILPMMMLMHEHNSDPEMRPNPITPDQREGRNDPCPCGSGKKYKHCHGGAMLHRTRLMSRNVLDDAHIHLTIRHRIEDSHRDVVTEVQAAVAVNDVVVVGMRQNPWPKKARRTLDAASIPYRYLEYGSYFSDWRRRLALKMWTGWPTFPMVFVKGTLVGGAEDVKRLIESGEMKQMLSGKFPSS